MNAKDTDGSFKNNRAFFKICRSLPEHSKKKSIYSCYLCVLKTLYKLFII